MRRNDHTTRLLDIKLQKAKFGKFEGCFLRFMAVFKIYGNFFFLDPPSLYPLLISIIIDTRGSLERNNIYYYPDHLSKSVETQLSTTWRDDPFQHSGVAHTLES